MSNVLALFSALLDQWFYFRGVGATQEIRGINVFDVSYVCYINEDFEVGDTVCHAFMAGDYCSSSSWVRVSA